MLGALLGVAAADAVRAMGGRRLPWRELVALGAGSDLWGDVSVVAVDADLGFGVDVDAVGPVDADQLDEHVHPGCVGRGDSGRSGLRLLEELVVDEVVASAACGDLGVT